MTGVPIFSLNELKIGRFQARLYVNFCQWCPVMSQAPPLSVKNKRGFPWIVSKNIPIFNNFQASDLLGQFGTFLAHKPMPIVICPTGQPKL